MVEKYEAGVGSCLRGRKRGGHEGWIVIMQTVVGWMAYLRCTRQGGMVERYKGGMAMRYK